MLRKGVCKRCSSSLHCTPTFPWLLPVVQMSGHAGWNEEQFQKRLAVGRGLESELSGNPHGCVSGRTLVSMTVCVKMTIAKKNWRLFTKLSSRDLLYLVPCYNPGFLLLKISPRYNRRKASSPPRSFSPHQHVKEQKLRLWRKIQPPPRPFPSWKSCVASPLCHSIGKNAEFVSFVSLEIKSYSL